jgi:tetratricopeptide (TPR) repeat protein
MPKPYTLGSSHKVVVTANPIPEAASGYGSLERPNPGAELGDANLRTPARKWPRRVLPPAAIGLLTALAYIGSISFGFVYDDEGVILGNQLIKSWRHIPSFFSQNVWGFDPTSASDYYRPVFLLWMLINRTFFGLNPIGWHLAAVGLHVVCVMLVYVLAMKLTRTSMTAIAAALIFGLHPIHIQAVSWVSGTNETIMAAFFISAFISYLNCLALITDSSSASRGSAWAWGAGAVLLYAMALLCKETAVVFPVLVFGTELIYARNRAKAGAGLRTSLRAVLPFGVVTVIYLVARTLILKGLPHTRTPLSNLTILYTWPTYAWSYLRLLVWPVHLSLIYDTPYVRAFGLRQVLIPAIGIALVGTGLILCCKRWLHHRQRQAAWESILWLILLMLPLFDLRLLPRDQAIQDRYLYLPSLGCSMLLAIAISKIPGRRLKLFGQPALAVITILIVSVVLWLATTSQSIYWANDLLLYSRCVTIAPNSIVAKVNLGVELSKREDYERALDLFGQVIRTDPGNWMAVSNAGYDYYRLGNMGEATKYLELSIRINPNGATAHLCLGLARLELGQLDGAESSLRRAIEIKPNGDGFHEALGIVLRQKGDLAGAIQEFRAEVANNPERNGIQGKLEQTELELSHKANDPSGLRSTPGNSQ